MSTEVFKTKTAAILIVDPASGVRPMMSATLRESGFNRVMAVDSLSEALNVMATEPIDWLITSLLPDGEVNALQVLQLTRKEPKLDHVMVSLFVASDERAALPKAFALGLFTCHKKPFNKDQFRSEMGAVLSNLEANHWNATLASAQYIRTALVEAGDTKGRLAFEKALSQAFPEEVGLQLHLAEAHFAVGNSPAARNLLWQTSQLRPDLDAQVRALSERHLTKETEGAAGGWKDLDIRSCVIVDPDTTVQMSLKETLGTMGAKEILAFDNGDACWAALQKRPEPNLLVMEWRIPGLISPMLLQRCRAHGFHKLSIIVNSSLVPPQDEALLLEMGVTAINRKPFRKDDFLNCVASTIERAQRPTDLRGLEQKIRTLLSAGDVPAATGLMQSYINKSPNQTPNRTQLEAEFAFAAGDYRSARDLAATSVRLGNKAVTVLNLLGKCLMQLRDFPAALKVFARADSIAPNCIGRLCAIAESQQELGDSAAAKATLKQLTSLDPANQAVINTQVNIGLAAGDKALVQEALDQFRPTSSILAFLNNKAIAHARAGEFDAGIVLYNNALTALPAKEVRLRVAVAYNLALAYARKQDVANVIKALTAAPTAEDATLFRKINSLLGRARAAQSSGNLLQLMTEASLPAVDIDKKAAKLIGQFKTLATTKKHICCYGIYHDDATGNDLITALLASSPTFHSRQVATKTVAKADKPPN